jgi:hypothetical protein
VEFALGSAMAIAMYILDKSGKTSWPLNVALLVLMTAFILHPALSIPWAWATPILAMKIWRVCLIASAVLLGVTWFGIWTWPDLATYGTPNPISTQIASSGTLLTATDLRVGTNADSSPKWEVYMTNFSKSDPVTVLPPNAYIEDVHSKPNDDEHSTDEIMPGQTSWYTWTISADKEAQEWLKAKLSEVVQGKRRVTIELKYRGVAGDKWYSKEITGRFSEGTFSTLETRPEKEIPSPKQP